MRRSDRACLLCSPHHLDVVGGEVRAVGCRAVKESLGAPLVSTSEEFVDRPSCRCVDCRSSGDEQSWMPVEPSDQQVPLVQKVAEDLCNCFTLFPGNRSSVKRIWRKSPWPQVARALLIRTARVDERCSLRRAGEMNRFRKREHLNMGRFL